MNYTTSRTAVSTGLATLFAAFLAGCGSPTNSSIRVNADLNRAAVSAADKKFVLAFDNPAVEQMLLPFRQKLQATLVQLGYQPVLLPMDATVVVGAFAETDRLIMEKRAVSASELQASMNPDSSRYKNVAGMVSGGRYENLLNDRPTNPGEVFIGPENEIIKTGDLRPDPEPVSHPDRDVVRKINRVVLFALETPIPANPSEAKMRWRVEVIGNVAPDEPAPELDRLIEIAIQNIAKESHGPLPDGA